ncbi:hypothetical protein HGRIS_009259 [Hohenbuehelia grisea]|uniref:BOD1/SHG1 domain-containing protein n=1 Tax=Hohenbuehelia grisea TaxID=104357 RepID=A0ABR3J104_9AGAR
MVATTPKQLVEESSYHFGRVNHLLIPIVSNSFKKSGEFDRIRRDLLKDFQKSDASAALKARIEDIARARLNSDQKLRYMPQESVHRELVQEVERYPIVERAAAEFHAFSDPTFISSLKKSVHRTLLEGRGEKLDAQMDTTEDDNREIHGKTSDEAGEAKADGKDITTSTPTVQKTDSPLRPSPAPIPIAVVPPSPEPSAVASREHERSATTSSLPAETPLVSNDVPSGVASSALASPVPPEETTTGITGPAKSPSLPVAPREDASQAVLPVASSPQMTEQTSAKKTDPDVVNPRDN